MNTNKLKYTDSHDHSLGIVGMAIGLYAYGCGEFLVSLSLKEGQQDFVLSDDFLNPPVNINDPADTLETQMEHFKVYCGMLFSNYYCRRFVVGRTPAEEDIQLVEKHLCDIASKGMGIDVVDARHIAQESQQNFRQLFGENMLCVVARALANDLHTKKEMRQDEIDDRLSSIFE